MNIRDILNKKTFYDSHVNFSERTLIDYEISPGTNAKFNIIKNQLGKRQFDRAIDIGCSGNSILPFLDNIHHRFYCVNCYARERKVGMFKGWALLFLLMSAGILVIVLLQKFRT